MRFTEPVAFTEDDLDYLETEAERLADEIRDRAETVRDWDNFEATPAEARAAAEELNSLFLQTYGVYSTPQQAVNQETGRPDRYGHILNLIEDGEQADAIEKLSDSEYRHEAWDPAAIVDSLSYLMTAQEEARDVVQTLVDRYGVDDDVDISIGADTTAVEHVIDRVADDFEDTELYQEQSTQLY